MATLTDDSSRLRGSCTPAHSVNNSFRMGLRYFELGDLNFGIIELMQLFPLHDIASRRPVLARLALKVHDFTAQIEILFDPAPTSIVAHPGN